MKRLLSLLSLLFVGGLAYAGLTQHVWTSAGVRYACSVTANSKVFRCVSPEGKVVYVSGDTEQGCRLNGDVVMVIRRTPETQCYQDLSADPEVERRYWEEVMGGWAEEPILPVEELLEEEGLEEERALSGEEESPSVETERSAEGRMDELLWEEPSDRLELPLLVIPCEDGVEEGDFDWSAWIGRL